MRDDERPAARTNRVVMKAVGDEILVYDLERQQAHSPNPVAAAVWRACDGTRAVTGIADVVSRELGRPVPGEVVRYALGSLGRAGLLGAPMIGVAVTRRDLMRRLGTAAAVALPLVTTITVPTAAQAQSQSCIPIGQSGCQAPSDCCPPSVNCPVLCNIDGVCQQQAC